MGTVLVSGRTSDGQRMRPALSGAGRGTAVPANNGSNRPAGFGGVPDPHLSRPDPSPPRGAQGDPLIEVGNAPILTPEGRALPGPLCSQAGSVPALFSSMFASGHHFVPQQRTPIGSEALIGRKRRGGERPVRKRRGGERPVRNTVAVPGGVAAGDSLRLDAPSRCADAADAD